MRDRTTTPRSTARRAPTRSQVLATQNRLYSAGYHVARDGIMGPQTRSALAAQRARQAASAWNARNARSVAVRTATKATNSRSTIRTRTNYRPPTRGHNARGKAGSGSGGQNSQDNSSSGLDYIDESMANQGGSPMDPNAAADQAAAQYQAALAAAQQQLGQNRADRTQHLADIANWYGQVLSSKDTAQGRNKEASAQGVQSVRDATNAIVASLGGAANQGSPLVAASGNNDANTQQALGTAEDQFQTDLTPILQSEKSGQQVSEGSRMDRLAADIQSQMMDLQGQQAAARAQAIDQANQYNSGLQQDNLANLMKIREYNNNLDQQAWDNQLKAAEANAALKMSGQKLNLTRRNTNSLINSRNANAQTARGRLTLAQQQAKARASKGGFVPWLKLSGSDRQNFINAAVGNAIDPNANGALIDPSHRGQVNAWNHAWQYLQGQGFSSAARSGRGTPAHQSMQALLDAAISRAIAMNQANAAARAAAANG